MEFNRCKGITSKGEYSYNQSMYLTQLIGMYLIQRANTTRT